MDWLNLVLSMNEGDILFIDDIEKVNWSCDELICTSIEDNWVDIVLGKDFNCKVTRIWIPHFTLIGITKNLHKVSPIIYQRLKKGK
jgi:Holliday junction DNA helicase RuvB